MKIARTIRSSSKAPPTETDNRAIPKASTPAEIVPKARLNPLLRVAPNSRKKKKLIISNNYISPTLEIENMFNV